MAEQNPVEKVRKKRVRKISSPKAKKSSPATDYELKESLDNVEMNPDQEQSTTQQKTKTKIMDKQAPQLPGVEDVEIHRKLKRSTSELQEIVVDKGDRPSSATKSSEEQEAVSKVSVLSLKKSVEISDQIKVTEVSDQVNYKALNRELENLELEQDEDKSIGVRRKATLSEIFPLPVEDPVDISLAMHKEQPQQVKSEASAVLLDSDISGNETTTVMEEDEERASKSLNQVEPEVVEITTEEDILVKNDSNREEEDINVAEIPVRRNLEPNGNLEGADSNESGEETSPDPKDIKQIQQQVNNEIPYEIEQDEDTELPWAMYKGYIKKPLEAADEQLPLSDDESQYVPPKNEDAPDLYEVMGSLDSGDTELEAKTSPPSLFASAQQQVMHKYVEDLKLGLAEEEISEYLDEFEKHVEREVLMIGDISLEEVQNEERRLREDHISFQQQEAKQQRDRQQAIMLAMEKAKRFVMERFRGKNRQLRMKQEHLMQRDRLLQDRIHRSFRRSENQLRKALKKRKGEVKTMYGDLIFADGQYGGSKGRRWKVDWNRTPQPIQIKLKCLRGVKDKLPASRYVLMASLYDRLSGHVMKWSNLKGQQWGGATLPLYHNGEFYNVELAIDQSVFTVCPSRPDMRPGMILVFELFILRGAVTPTDKVVGWACFPICDGNFNVIEGKYKTPLLRGDMDPAIDKFETTERLMASDLEHWLCNLYFEIIRLPRYMAGQKEYEVELQFSSSMVSYPVRTQTGEDFVDGENPQYGSHPDIASPAVSRMTLRSSSQYGLEGVMENSEVKSGPSGQNLTVEVPENKRRKSSSARISSANSSKLQLKRASNLSSDLRQRSGSRVSTTDPPNDDPIQRPFTVHGSRKVVEEQGLILTDDEDDNESSGTDFSDDDVYVVKKEGGYKPVKGQPGMYYKIHQNNPVDVYSRKLYTMLPKTPLLTRNRKKRKLTHFEELDQHSFAVKPTWSNKGSIPRRGREKLQYIKRMLLTELGLSQWRSREFWAMLLMLLLTWWMRLYLHYVGQWIFLTASLIPINKFEFFPYTVNLNYQNTLLRTREEITMVVLGPFTSILVLILMVLFSWFFQALFDRFPDIFSRFIMAFGIQTAFDPVSIIIVDSAILRFKQLGGDSPIGDAFKLYWHFSRYYNNDNVALFVSISMTLFLYTVTVFCTCTILYMYFLRLHNNGRMIDVFWRLHGDEDHFFQPYDLELSNEELNYICRKAEQWRGEEGERRKIAVYDYVWEEEEIPEEGWDNPNARGQKTGTKEITTHVSLHTLHLDGLRELYRHFLRLPEGSIVEVFGEMNIPGIDEGVKQALQKGTNYQDTSGLRRNQSMHSVSSIASSLGKPRRTSSYFLDVPTVAPV